MAELIAQGPRINDRWRQALPEGQMVVLGRDSGDWSVPWEPFLSRRHAELTWRKGQLEVRKHAEASNPVFRRGTDTAHFVLRPGEHFVIGQTMFLVALEQALTEAVDSAPLQERTFRVPEPKPAKTRERAWHLEALARLPEVLTAEGPERPAQLLRLLLAGLPRADVAALIAVDGDEQPARLIHCERRQPLPGDLPLSRRLVREVLRRQETVLHIWRGTPGGEQFTQAETFDWAFCVPVKGQGRALYVTGCFRDADASTVLDDTQAGGLADDVPFAELLAGLWSALDSSHPERCTP